jgi:hypothetical protein
MEPRATERKNKNKLSSVYDMRKIIKPKKLAFQLTFTLSAHPLRTISHFHGTWQIYAFVKK